MTADELAEFLVNGGGWRLALEQREEFQRETARQAAERAPRESPQRERKPAAKQ